MQKFIDISALVCYNLGMRNVRKKYYKHKVEDLVHVSKIVTVHYFELPPTWRSVGESHDFWELIYIDKGRITCNVDGEDVSLEEGEILFHKPLEYHIHMTGEAGASMFIVSFVSKSEAIHFFENKRMRLDRDLLKFIYMLIEESRLVFSLRDTNHQTKKMPFLSHPALGGLQAITNILEILLINLMREGSEEEGNPAFIIKEDFDEYITNQVIAYLGENIGKNVKMEDICHHLNYTKSYLFRQFKSVTGQSIMAYFTTLKVKEAKRLLRETEMSVTDIAAALAFDTPNYFSKTFKRVSGYTPMQYKKMRRLQNR